MVKRSRPKYNRIRDAKIYTSEELAKTIGVHLQTVLGYIRKGMPVINPQSRPYLIKGVDAKKFLIQQSKSRKCTIKIGEFYCLRCKKAVKSSVSNIIFEEKNRILGKNAKKVDIKGVCKKCGYDKLRIFSSEKKAEEFLEVITHPNYDQEEI